MSGHHPWPPPSDAAGASWSSITGDRIEGLVVYEDRELTRWEWVRVHVFRRRDPRILAIKWPTKGDE